MAIPSDKQQLLMVIAKMVLKRSALVLQRLVLAGEEEPQETNVRHYDLQCEGTEMLLGFFKTKHQNIKLKAFSLLRDYRPGQAASSPRAAKGTTRRTYINSNFAGSDYSPIKGVHYQTMRSSKGKLGKHTLQGSRLDRSSNNLKKLLNRVKGVNRRHKHSQTFRQKYYSTYQQDFRENYSQQLPRGQASRMDVNSARLPERLRTNPTVTSHEACYPELREQCRNCGSQVMSKRGSRRQFILEKFESIELGLDRLGESRGSQLSYQIMGEIQNIKQRLRL